MPSGKKLKLVKGQQQKQRRAKRQANAGSSGSSSIQPKRKPERVLLRHLCFLNPEHTKYVSVGFYPGRDYQACVEFGSARQALVVLTPSFLAALSVHLPKLCEHLCRQEPYSCNELSFRLQTVSGEETAAKMTMDRRSITLKVGELSYLLLTCRLWSTSLRDIEWLKETWVNMYIVRHAPPLSSRPRKPPRYSCSMTCYSRNLQGNFKSLFFFLLRCVYM
jgi:hypothetical protein